MNNCTIVRAEFRCLSNANVKKYLNIKSLSDFYRADILSVLNDRFNCFVSKRILGKDFKSDTNMLKKLSQLDQLLAIKNEVGERQVINEWLMTPTVLERMIPIGDIENFVSILKHAGCSRSTIDRQKNDLKARIDRAYRLCSTSNKHQAIYQSFVKQLLK